MNYEKLSKLKKSELIQMVQEKLKEHIKSDTDLTIEFRELYESSDYEQECIGVAAFDNRTNIIAKKILFKGGITNCQNDVRSLFRYLLSFSGCTGFAICHNHPSGDERPSKSDDEVTKELARCAELMHFHFLDHIVITRTDSYSYMKDNNYALR